MTRIIRYIVILIVTIMIILFVYRNYLEFNNKAVKNFISDEADKYGDNKNEVFKILHDAAQHILADRNLTNQVRTMAKASGMPKEQVLVNAAIEQAKLYKYIK